MTPSVLALASCALLLAGGCRSRIERKPVVVTAPGGDCGEWVNPQDEEDEVAGAAALMEAIDRGARAVRVTGDIDEPITITASGEPDRPIVISFGDARVTAPVVLQNVEHLVVRGGSFVSDGTFSWLTGRAVRDVAILGSAFDVSCFGCGDAFPGIDIENGRDLRMCGNAVGSWIGDAVWMRDIDGMLVDQNDFGRAQGEHSLFSYLGSDLVLRDNVFRNPWDRVLHIASLEPHTVTERALIEHNVFLASDWDHRSERPFDDTRQDGGGAFEAIRLLGVDHIFRGNLVVSTQRGNGEECHGGLVMTTFSTELWSIEKVQGNRIYHNVFLDNHSVAVGVLDHLEAGGIGDNVVTHNVFAENVGAAIGLCSERRDSRELTVRDNLFARDAAVALIRDDGGLGRVDFSSGDVAGFHDNAEAGVTFADRDAVRAVVDDRDALTLAGLDVLFAALQVVDAPAAPPLTRVVEQRDERTLLVEDASFFTDGRGVVDGDTILVGDDLAARIEAQIERIDGNAVTFAAPLPTLGAGTGLYWAAFLGAPP